MKISDLLTILQRIEKETLETEVLISTPIAFFPLRVTRIHPGLIVIEKENPDEPNALDRETADPDLWRNDDHFTSALLYSI